MTAKTELLRIVSIPANYRALQQRVFVFVSRWVPKSEREEMVSQTFVAAVQREVKGTPWNPNDKTVELHLFSVAEGLIANRRRSRKRKPERARSLKEDDDVASESALADDQLMDHEERKEEVELESVADEILKQLAAETDSNLTLRLVEAWRKGIKGHEQLAAELQCTVRDVRAAMKRIQRRAVKIREILTRERTGS